jgi:hypothetical protein
MHRLTCRRPIRERGEIGVFCGVTVQKVIFRTQEELLSHLGLALYGATRKTLQLFFLKLSV